MLLFDKDLKQKQRVWLHWENHIECSLALTECCYYKQWFYLQDLEIFEITEDATWDLSTSVISKRSEKNAKKKHQVS